MNQKWKNKQVYFKTEHKLITCGLLALHEDNDTWHSLWSKIPAYRTSESQRFSQKVRNTSRAVFHLGKYKRRGHTSVGLKPRKNTT